MDDAQTTKAAPKVRGSKTPAEHGEARARAGATRPLKKTIYPKAVAQTLYGAARVRVAMWDRSLRHVEEVQTKQLLRITQHCKDTTFGRRYGFGDIRSYEQFAARVPCGDYDSHSAAFEAMRTGERGILVPEFIKYFGNSSGSSTKGKPKFLPISEQQVAFQRGSAADAVFRYLVWRGETDYTSGFTLGLFPPTTMKKEGPVFITTNPSLQSINMPAFTKPAQLPSAEIREIADYDAKLEKIVDAYIDHDVRMVAGTTCWFSILFDKLIANAKKKGRNVSTVAELWPNLRFMVGGGVSADPYMPVIRERMGRDDVVLVDTYNATEGGIYAASDHTGEPGMLMLPHRGTFFEFVRLEEHDKPGAPRFALWQVELDRPYAIVVSTLSGLYAYKLGDIVRFPRKNRIEFVGRLSGCLSVTQELTTHVEIERAVAFAVDQVPCTTVDFGASADVGAKSRYLLFVEFAPGRRPENMEAFTRAFDEGLCRENRVYREHRKDNVAILPPRVVPLREGGARHYLDLVTRGNVQGKFPRIIDPLRKEQVSAYAEAT